MKKWIGITAMVISAVALFNLGLTGLGWFLNFNGNFLASFITNSWLLNGVYVIAGVSGALDLWELIKGKLG